MLQGLQKGADGSCRKGAQMQNLTPNQQLLIATAWVDHHLDPAEAILLRQVLEASGLTPTEIDAALQPPGPSLDEVLTHIPDEKSREDVMHWVLRMCFSDGVLEVEEFDLIERVAQKLGLDQDTLDKMRDEISAE